jgi:hypothetical protein
MLIRYCCPVTKSWEKEKGLDSSSVARFGHSTTKVGHWLFVLGGSTGEGRQANDLNLLNLGM